MQRISTEFREFRFIARLRSLCFPVRVYIFSREPCRRNVGAILLTSQKRLSAFLTLMVTLQEPIVNAKGTKVRGNKKCQHGICRNFSFDSQHRFLARTAILKIAERSVKLYFETTIVSVFRSITSPVCTFSIH